jgi:hypothetical protein
MGFKNLDPIKKAIADGHRRGVCDLNGDSIKNKHGKPIAKPRCRSQMRRIMTCKRGYPECA